MTLTNMRVHGYYDGFTFGTVLKDGHRVRYALLSEERGHRIFALYRKRQLAGVVAERELARAQTNDGRPSE